MKNIRILIIEPCNQHPTFERVRPNGSLGPAYLIGALRRYGFSADYLDATVGPIEGDLSKSFFNREPMENGNIRVGMKEVDLYEVISNYDLIATSSIFSVQTRMHFEIAKIVKEVERHSNKKILTISGGVNARALKEHFLSNGFDLIGMGDGELTIVQIAEQLATGKPDFFKVERVAFRLNGKTVITRGHPSKPKKFIDDLPHPALDAMPLEHYKVLGLPHGGYPIPGTKFANIQTSRGCQDSCTFCHISLEKQQIEESGNIGNLRWFSNQRVSEDVTNAYNLGIRRLYFEDDNLFFNKKRLIMLADSLKREGLTYSNVNGANLRFLVTKTDKGYMPDKEFISTLASFGLDELSMPFESRNPIMLKKYATNKFKPEEMNPFGIVEEIKAAGIRPTAGFMIGFRDESWDSILTTKNFAAELMKAGLDSVGFGIPVPYPGSLDFEYEMTKSDAKMHFDSNLLMYTDQMHVRGKPLFHTEVNSEILQAAVKDFWLELNSKKYTDASISTHALS